VAIVSFFTFVQSSSMASEKLIQSTNSSEPNNTSFSRDNRSKINDSRMEKNYLISELNSTVRREDPKIDNTSNNKMEQNIEDSIILLLGGTLNQSNSRTSNIEALGSISYCSRIPR
jgi:hypothetical protein